MEMILSKQAFLYQMFLSINSHGQRSVGDHIGVALERLENHRRRSSPVLAIDDRSYAATLVCWVDHRQRLGV